MSIHDEIWRWRMLGYEGPKYGFYFWFVGWDCLQLGFHICVGAPNVEVHVPFGFFRLGRHGDARVVELGRWYLGWLRRAEQWAGRTNR